MSDEPKAKRGRPRLNREPMRPDLEKGGRVVVMRDGKEVSRRRSGNDDKFHIDPAIIPAGMTYEWKVCTIYGEDQIAAQTGYAQDGWIAVPADRHPGMFMQAGYKGPIIRDGLMLMEREVELTEEAREEDQMRARRQLQDQKQQFGMSVPSGFTGTPASVKSSYERSGVARPALPIE